MKMIRRTVSHVARNFQVFVVFCVSSAVWCGARFSFRIGPAAFGSGFLDEIGPENVTLESRNEGVVRRGGRQGVRGGGRGLSGRRGRDGEENTSVDEEAVNDPSSEGAKRGETHRSCENCWGKR